MDYSYTATELRLLWTLKRHGPLIRQGTSSLLNQLADELGKSPGTTRTILRDLEKRCLVLRTYQKPQPAKFGDARGNALLRVELIDPDMQLPPPPKAIPLAVVVARENEELAERHATEPSVEQIVDALIDRALELQKQIDRLQDLVAGLSAENDRLRHTPKPAVAHMTQRVQDVLTPEQWEALRKR
jgi:hypothetical protein